jgi:pentatricopeptide repeat protein
MYGKCGRLEEANNLFTRAPKDTLLMWNAMFSVLGVHGKGLQALNLYNTLKRTNLQPDRFTIMSVLMACSHSGLVDQAVEFLRKIESPSIEIYNCVIDALSRANRLSEAEKMIINMPCKPDIITWTTFLGGCRKHKDIQRAERAIHELNTIDDKESSTYVLMSNIYGETGNVEQSKQVWQQMKDKKLRKVPGTSFIEDNNGVVHQFIVGDTSHKQYHAIEERLDTEFEKLRSAGFVHDISFVSHAYETYNEKIRHLCRHSEKLALAFGLINTPEGSPLLVTKNLRVCPDCHTATKLIALLNKREITMRDSSRFHIFKDGKCSCGDYW